MNFDAAIFDMDGVITNTAVVHSAAWKRTFDEYLREREAQTLLDAHLPKAGRCETPRQTLLDPHLPKAGRCGAPRESLETFREFTQAEYLAFVDGRPRYRGVYAFLRSRGIEIPFGDPADQPGMETVCGLGNRKNELFNRVVDEQGVEVYGSTIKLIRQLRERGVRVGVATSSKNCVRVLEKAGILGLFETRVDGEVLAELGLKGKPEPDIFLNACDNLGACHERAMVVEDAVSGVQAGARGHFGLVVGVARENNGEELRSNGADIVVGDLGEISVQEIDRWFESKFATAL